MGGRQEGEEGEEEGREGGGEDRWRRGRKSRGGGGMQ